MLTAILSFFGSSAMGSLIGWLGGAFNRWIDLKGKTLDYQFQLDKAKADKEYMLEEAKVALEREKEVTNREIEVAGYAAMSSSYDADKETYGGGFVDAVRGLLRPLLTLCFFVLNVGLVVWVADMVQVKEVPFSNEQLFDLAMKVIAWSMFQGGVCIGWWFANRSQGGK